MRFAEIFKTELFSKYGQKAGCYINEIYDIIRLPSEARVDHDHEALLHDIIRRSYARWVSSLLVSR